MTVKPSLFAPLSISESLLSCRSHEVMLPVSFILIAQANNYVKCDMLRPGRADSACYHIAKGISYLYEDELNRLARGRKVKVAY